jgi:hypothetical protein
VSRILIFNPVRQLEKLCNVFHFATDKHARSYNV